MKRRRLLCGMSLLLVVLLFAGCWDNGNSSLTGPSGNAVLIMAGLSSVYYGLLEVTLSLDGKIIDRGPTSSSAGTAGWTFSATVDNLRSGNHTLTFTIVRQFAARQTYSATVQIYDISSDKSLDLGTKQAVLAEGGSITFTFRY